MTTVQTRPSSNPKPVANARATKVAIPKTPAEAQSKPSLASKADSARREAHFSKHDRVLALLSKPDGATIEDMMDATSWQQHSVRGLREPASPLSCGTPFVCLLSINLVERPASSARSS